MIQISIMLIIQIIHSLNQITPHEPQKTCFLTFRLSINMPNAP